MKVRLVVDEHVPPAIVRGLRLRVEGVDVVRVQDVGLRTAPDPVILDWAAGDSRVLVTQDIRTMPDFAYERVDAGQAMPGVFVLPPKMPLGVAIDELATIVAASDAGEWVDRVVYLPLS